MEDDLSHVDVMMEMEEEEPATTATPMAMAPLEFDTLDEATREELEEIRNGN